MDLVPLLKAAVFKCHEWQVGFAGISYSVMRSLTALSFRRDAHEQRNRRLRGSLGATLNREIGFVSSSFSFRAWRACERARRSCECVQSSECSSWAGVGCGKLSCCLRPLCEAQGVVCVCVGVLKQNGSKSVSRGAHCVCFTWVL